MNLAEIRKKAGAARKEESPAAVIPELSAEPEMSDFPETLDIPMTFETNSEPPAAVVSCFEDMISEENYQEELAEPELSEANDATLGSEPALNDVSAVPSISDTFIAQTALLNSRLPPEPTFKSNRTSLIELIVAGREAANNSDDMLSARVGDSPLDIEEYLCFRVAEEEYAISIMSIKEIIKPREVTEVPRVPQFIRGVISLRGLIIPVMDMRCRLSLPLGNGTGRERIIVVRNDAGFCGILVDEVVQVARVSKKDVEEPPAVLDGIDRAFVKGLGHYDGRMIILLDLAAILDAGVH